MSWQIDAARMEVENYKLLLRQARKEADAAEADAVKWRLKYEALWDDADQLRRERNWALDAIKAGLIGIADELRAEPLLDADDLAALAARLDQLAGRE